MRVLGLPKKLFGDNSSTSAGTAPLKDPSVPASLVMPIVAPVAATTFPSPEQRAQLQTMGKQSCTSLKRLAFSMSTQRESWERLETDNNMEMYYLKDSDDYDATIHVCGIAHVHASMEEFAAAMRLPAQKSYSPIAPSSTGPRTLANELLAAETLVTVDDHTSIQWLGMKCPENMLHRDFVVLQRVDTFADGDLHGHIISMHSMDFPGAPPQFDQVGVPSPPEAYRFVRGGMYRSGFVIMEDSGRSGVLDVFALFKVDFKGDKQLKQSRATLQQWFRFLGDLNQHYLSAKLVAKGAPRIRHAPAPNAKSKARRCESCTQPFKFQLQFRAPVRDQCLMCGAIICGACKIDFKATTGMQVFCIPCLDKWNPDPTTSIKFIQPTNLPGQSPSPVAEHRTSPAAKPIDALHNIIAPGEPILRSEMVEPMPRRRSVGQDTRSDASWPSRVERSCSVPDPIWPPPSIAAMETVHLDSLDYRVSLYGRFSISTASKADLEARLEWIAASTHAMDATVAALTQEGKLRRAMQVMHEKKALKDEALQVQAALDELAETSGESLEAKAKRLQAALTELAHDAGGGDLRSKRDRLLRRATLKSELKAAQEALQKKQPVTRRDLNGSLLFNPEIFVLDGQMDVLRGELHHCVAQLSAAQKRGDQEAIENLTAQRFEIKEKMSAIQDELVQLGAPSVGNRSTIAARRSTIVLGDNTATAPEREEEFASDLDAGRRAETLLHSPVSELPTIPTEAIAADTTVTTTPEPSVPSTPPRVKVAAHGLVVLDDFVPLDDEDDDDDDENAVVQDNVEHLMEPEVAVALYDDDTIAKDCPVELGTGHSDTTSEDDDEANQSLMSDRCIRLYTLTNRRLDLTDGSFDFEGVKTFAL
ncbi:hypothetical protein ACHHYP_05147 [Achlya hypogyna]|uniref:FYVE-type domain-containing protein n=1 Tax=Achlya hypogyna TaxID=1202772 RepID=A0A1V9YYM7_ACHHY|nr:hypothetical protein ACHHYP_05147 [Achlya hypogyna]